MENEIINNLSFNFNLNLLLSLFTFEYNKITKIMIRMYIFIIKKIVIFNLNI